MEPIAGEEKSIFKIFRLGLFLKGVDAIAEVSGGLLVLLVNKAHVVARA